ncbi:hypothetical protein O6H91_01G069600 [Diphasiastrum complanatum]|uniref:Uncharacterized protein n=1 Tax=Diphasiastrum complanatum TaxID=34168 RepID=A0ACC2ESA3_DIPCM|nr:hypothetical protein O6H91_01G069600 [Diphasiastrum complanatum]
MALLCFNETLYFDALEPKEIKFLSPINVSFDLVSIVLCVDVYYGYNISSYGITSKKVPFWYFLLRLLSKNISFSKRESILLDIQDESQSLLTDCNLHIHHFEVPCQAKQDIDP